VTYRFGVITDIHLGPSRQFGAVPVPFPILGMPPRMALIARALDYVVGQCAARGAQDIILAGDILADHEKTSGHVLVLIRKILWDLVHSHSVNLFLMDGNHDLITGRRDNTLSGVGLVAPRNSVVLERSLWPDAYSTEAPLIGFDPWRVVSYTSDTKQTVYVPALKSCRRRLLVMPWVPDEHFPRMLAEAGVDEADVVICHQPLAGVPLATGATLPEGVDVQELMKVARAGTTFISGDIHHRMLLDIPDRCSWVYVGPPCHHTFGDVGEIGGVIVDIPDAGQVDVTPINNPLGPFFHPALVSPDELYAPGEKVGFFRCPRTPEFESRVQELGIEAFVAWEGSLFLADTQTVGKPSDLLAPIEQDLSSYVGNVCKEKDAALVLNTGLKLLEV